MGKTSNKLCKSIMNIFTYNYSYLQQICHLTHKKLLTHVLTTPHAAFPHPPPSKLRSELHRCASSVFPPHVSMLLTHQQHIFTSHTHTHTLIHHTTLPFVTGRLVHAVLQMVADIHHVERQLNFFWCCRPVVGPRHHHIAAPL